MNKKLFYFLSFTWGLPMTLLGCLVSVAMLISGHKPKKYGYCYHFKIGNNWGGMELGCIFLTDKTPSEHTKQHEHGHAIQNCFFGILMPFIVCIPSAIRYWYREIRYHRRGLMPPTDYDDIWFEGQATRLGTEFMNSGKCQ